MIKRAVDATGIIYSKFRNTKIKQDFLNKVNAGQTLLPCNIAP